MNKFILYFFITAFALSLQSQNMPKPISRPIKGTGVSTFLSHKKNNNPLLKNAFPDRFCLYDINGKEYISLLIKVDKNNKLDFLKNYDVILGSKQGRIVTLKINTDDLARFCEDSNVIEVETARKGISPMLKNSRKDMNVEQVWQGLGLRTGYKGKGVIVGIADWGIDYTHPNFYDTLEQNYRILAAWDQFKTSGPTPTGFSYGTLIEGKDNLLEVKCDTFNIYEYGYHATHVAGITGGGGATTEYKGIAPEIEWLFCTWIPDETSVLDGYVWMRDYAKNLGRRLVINNSWGLYLYGYMDGSSMLDEFINNMSEQDSVVFTVSAGNNGGEDFHIKADFSQTNSADTLKSEVGFGPSSTKNYWGQTVTLQGENNTTFSTRVEIYDRNWQKIHQSDVLLCNGSVIADTLFVTGPGDTVIYRASSRYPQDNRPLIDWEIRKTKLDNSLTHVVLCINATQGVVHAWNVACLTTAVGNWGYAFTDSREGYLSGNDEYGISEPALAEKVITVGATKVQRVNRPSTLALFSSKGPTLCSYLKPEIVAPGQAVTSSISSFTNSYLTTITTSFEGKDYPFSAISGTSMSCPMVTGSVALMLEANPSLSPAEIKEIITQTADTNVNSGQCPNDSWGYGYINTLKAVQKAEAKVSLSSPTSLQTIAVYPVPTQNILYLKNFQIKGKVKVSDMMSRTIMETQITNSQIDVSNLKSGVYILYVLDGEHTYKSKFVKK